jgi:hypothetical protein
VGFEHPLEKGFHEIEGAVILLGDMMEDVKWDLQGQCIH